MSSRMMFCEQAARACVTFCERVISASGLFCAQVMSNSALVCGRAIRADGTHATWAIRARAAIGVATVGSITAAFALAARAPNDGAPTIAPAVMAASAADLQGIWESEPWAGITEDGRPEGGIAAVRAKSVLSGHPPYNAEWETRYQASLKAPGAQGIGATATSKTCSFAFPGAMESPALFQIVVTPQETLLLFATPEIRQIYTDGRSHPAADDLWPTPMGDSIGHWEGHTLVVETIARRPSKTPRVSSPQTVLSENARFTERIRRVSEDRLENEMTIEDPATLARPWTLTLRYRKVTNLDRLLPHDCAENDRNPIVDGKLTISAP